MAHIPYIEQVFEGDFVELTPKQAIELINSLNEHWGLGVRFQPVNRTYNFIGGGRITVHAGYEGKNGCMLIVTTAVRPYYEPRSQEWEMPADVYEVPFGETEEEEKYTSRLRYALRELLESGKVTPRRTRETRRGRETRRKMQELSEPVFLTVHESHYLSIHDGYSLREVLSFLERLGMQAQLQWQERLQGKEIPEGEKVGIREGLQAIPIRFPLTPKNCVAFLLRLRFRGVDFKVVDDEVRGKVFAMVIRGKEIPLVGADGWVLSRGEMQELLGQPPQEDVSPTSSILKALMGRLRKQLLTGNYKS